jgi:aspartate carbamoyltransferase catalytic subunit
MVQPIDRRPEGTHPYRRRPDPEPLAALPGTDALATLAGRSILRTDDLSKAELSGLFRTAAMLESGTLSARRSLSDRVVLTAFFEPSTRTRLSFESAVVRLGGMLLPVANTEGLSIAKGESLADTGAMLDNYADAVVVRHPSADALAELVRGGLEKPVISGGGMVEHPTQAMADWYALSKWKPGLLRSQRPRGEKLSIGVFGAPAHMRSVRSFLRFGLRFFVDSIASVTLVTGEDAPVDGGLRDEFRAAQVPLVERRELQRFSEDASCFDVIYQNVISPNHNRFCAREVARLSAHTRLKPDSVILHPLARLDELSTDLDNTPHNLYFSQAAGATFVRQALLLAVLDRLPIGARAKSR